MATRLAPGGEPLQLDPGAVLFPHGDPHHMSSGKEAPRPFPNYGIAAKVKDPPFESAARRRVERLHDRRTSQSGTWPGWANSSRHEVPTDSMEPAALLKDGVYSQLHWPALPSHLKRRFALPDVTHSFQGIPVCRLASWLMDITAG